MDIFNRHKTESSPPYDKGNDNVICYAESEVVLCR